MRGMNSSHWNYQLGAVFLLCLLAIGFAEVRAQEVRAQEAGKPLLLVASPSLQGAYRQTTLIAVPVGDSHLGFILNRATGVKLSKLFPGHAPSAAVAVDVHFGGPVQSESLFAMLRRDPGGQSLQLLGGLFVTGRAEAIQKIIEQTPNEARYFAGFVGWVAGELQTEIERGLWQVTEPDAALPFREDTSSMWEELSKRLGNPVRPRRGMIQAILRP